MKTAIRYLIMAAMLLGALSALLSDNVMGCWSLISLGIISEVMFRLGLVESNGQ